MGIEGSWDVTFTTAVGQVKEQWSIAPDGDGLRIRGTAETGETTDEPLTVDGGAFSFQVPVPNVPLKATIAGTLDGDRLTGSGKLASMPIGTFEATRTSLLSRGGAMPPGAS